MSREFNRRSKHSAIGATTARKWLVGESIPQQEKLTFLANWLQVPVQWLRYGVDEAPLLSAKEKRRLDRVLSDFTLLAERDKILVEALLKEMLRK